MSKNNSHEYFMGLALEQAHLAQSLGEVPVGAVLINQDQEIITLGHNSPISDHNPSAHAEINILKQAGEILKNYRLSNCDIYITLEPCVMCAGAMIHARIRHCYFGAFDPKTGSISSCDNIFNKNYHNHQVLFTGGILKQDCEDLLKKFFKSRRDKNK